MLTYWLCYREPAATFIEFDLGQSTDLIKQYKY